MKLLYFALALATAAACGDNEILDQPPDAGPPDGPPPSVTQLLRDKVSTIVVIYAENRGFDNMYAMFPGANGIPGVNPTGTGTVSPQVDRDAASTVLPKLPQSWNGVTANGYMPPITQAMSDGLQNRPYQLQATYSGFGYETITRDLVHRFFENRMQIGNRKNDRFAAFSDSGGLTMGYYDGSGMALWAIASRYVLADNFFMGAIGGSFLNHQYLICACAPEYPNADTDPAVPTIAMLDANGNLVQSATSPPSAIDGPPVYMLSGNLAPKDYFGDGTFRAVNTMQPPYQPSSNAYAASDTSHLYADRTRPNTLPPQTERTIGDELGDKGVTWKWYTGAYRETLTAATGDRVGFPQSQTPGAVPNYQFHHQPFNYYKGFDPVAGAAAREARFKDYTDLVADISAGALPQVVFYKPQGDLNQHPGYASVTAGDRHIADLIGKLEASPQFAHMIIVVTYDENGGWWDHVVPPVGDKVGPGMRIPAIIISPYAKAGTVDHTQYDTASILRLIARRFDLPPLTGVTRRDAALIANGGRSMGDLTAALDLTK
jgi:acid phosphatase